MCDEWMPVLKLPLTAQQLRQLPRHAAYRYEYVNGQAQLIPRPRHFHAVRDLNPLGVSGHFGLGHVQLDDWAEFVPLFSASFRTVQPFGSLDDATRAEAARQVLERTRRGGDGPLIEQASFVAAAPDHGLAGAILVTLLPEGDPCAWDSYYWSEPPPEDCIARRLGRPHLTWIFVAPELAGRGVGTALLASAVSALTVLGYTQLVSTFMLGNDASMLWHWRNGFRLLGYPGSVRLLPGRGSTGQTTDSS